MTVKVYKKKTTNKLKDSKFQDYYLSLDEEGRDKFAARADTTATNVLVNWIRRLGKTHPDHKKYYQSTATQPKSKTMLKIAKATRGKCSYEDMLDHFYRL